MVLSGDQVVVLSGGHVVVFSGHQVAVFTGDQQRLIGDPGGVLTRDSYVMLIGDP